jgi:hypothetical protein
MFARFATVQIFQHYKRRVKMANEMQEMFQRNVRLRKLSGEFTNMFGRSLDSFFDNFFGLDVIKFDEEVAKPFTYDEENCESTIQAVYRQWGEPGIRLLCKFDSLSDVEETLKEVRGYKYPAGYEQYQPREA